MDIFEIAKGDAGLSNDEIAALLEKALADWEQRKGAVKKALVIPPDFTRFHSNAGFISQVFYRLLTARRLTCCLLSERTFQSPRRSGRRCSGTSRTRR